MTRANKWEVETIATTRFEEGFTLTLVSKVRQEWHTVCTGVGNSEHREQPSPRAMVFNTWGHRSEPLLAGNGHADKKRLTRYSWG